MKIAVCIMATDGQPSLRNIEAFKKYVIAWQNENSAKLKHEYDFYIYWSDEDVATHMMDNDKDYPNVYNVRIEERESVYRTFEKTWLFFNFLEKQKKYDLYVRINISMFLNIRLLDVVADKFSNGCVYCNAINTHVNLNSEYANDIYPRGDLMIFDYNILHHIIEQGDKYMYCDGVMRNRIGVEHVDDCLIGICLIDGLGKDYYKRIYMLNYNFIPTYLSDYKEVTSEINRYAIGSRVKTMPPDVSYSGYSWDDNEYRKNDAEKMRILAEYYNEKNFDYSYVKLPDILVDKKKSRPTLAVQGVNVNVFESLYEFLGKKR